MPLLTPPTPPVPQSVLLRYKYRAGQISRRRASVQTSELRSPGGKQTSETIMVTVSRVQTVAKDGTATLEVGWESYASKRNGKPTPPNPKMLKFRNVIRISPLGIVTPIPANRKDANVRSEPLPAKPVSVGSVWETVWASPSLGSGRVHNRIDRIVQSEGSTIVTISGWVPLDMDKFIGVPGQGAHWRRVGRGRVQIHKMFNATLGATQQETVTTTYDAVMKEPDRGDSKGKEIRVKGMQLFTTRSLP